MKLLSIILLSLLTAAPTLAASPVVLELYTSQGCPSCPPADALLQKLAADPRVLALSFHVDYWDRPDWADGFSLRQSTLRQEQYQQVMKQENIYTPELVVDGRYAMLGSHRDEIDTAIEVASEHPKPMDVTVRPSADHKTLTVSFGGEKPGDDKTAGLWLIAFSPPAVSSIHGGDATGREMTSINNVTSIVKIGTIADTHPKPITIDYKTNPTSGYAVLVQEQAGRVIGAGYYMP